MASRILLKTAFAACLVAALLGAVGTAGAAPLRSSYYPNWDGNGCRNIVPSQIEWQCQAGAAMTTTTNQQYVYESVTLSVSTIGSYQPWQGSLQIIDVADSSQDCIVSIPAAAGTWECDISGAIGSELDIQLATSSPGVEIVQLAFAPLNQPTATATDTATATGQPTATPTDTVVPGSTSTLIPTNTPRPVKTALATSTSTPTALPSATPNPYDDCGDATFPLLNCTFIGGARFSPAPVDWTYGAPGGNAGAPECGPAGTNGFANPYVLMDATGGTICRQLVVAQDTGTVFVQYQANASTQIGPYNICVTGGCLAVTTGSCDIGTSNYCVGPLAGVTAGTSYYFDIGATANTSNGQLEILLVKVWVGNSTDTPTPGPSTSTPTPPLGSATDTPLPLPFDTGTPLATGTPCPGGCSVAEATSLPGAIDTVLPIDTSPLSPLEHLSVGRTACQTFGSAPIMVPQIHGTPVFGSSQPLSITWSLPVTGTTFTPCADPAFATTWWDLTWNLSIIVTFIAFLSWLIWYVRRLFQ